MASELNMMDEKRKVYWLTHVNVGIMIVGSLWIFWIAKGPILKTISLACAVGASFGAIEFYTGRKLNLGEVIDSLLMRRLEKKAQKRCAAT